MKTSKETFAGIGQRLKSARLKKGATQETLAAYCGWPRACRIAHYENGRRIPSFQSAYRMANVLEIPIEWLCFGKGD